MSHVKTEYSELPERHLHEIEFTTKWFHKCHKILSRVPKILFRARTAECMDLFWRQPEH
jgi:hypothetical protein